MRTTKPPFLDSTLFVSVPVDDSLTGLVLGGQTGPELGLEPGVALAGEVLFFFVGFDLMSCVSVAGLVGLVCLLLGVVLIGVFVVLVVFTFALALVFVLASVCPVNQLKMLLFRFMSGWKEKWCKWLAKANARGEQATICRRKVESNLTKGQ